MKKKIVKGIIYIIGLLILSFGIDLMILSNIGTSAWDALSVGLNKQYGLTIGTWTQVIGIVLILIIAVMKKQRPEVLPLVTMFILGIFIDLHLSWLVVQYVNWIYAFFIAMIGLILMAFGIALYLQAGFGFIPIDGFVMVIHDKTKWSIRVSKTAADIGALMIAYFLGGPIGLATIITTFLLGPLLQVFYRFFERQLNNAKLI